MTEEDEAFNEIERQAKQRKESVRAALQYSMQKPKIGCVNHDCDQCKAQRPWVGLTISERDECWRFSRTAEDAMEAVEAKLKEKNT